MLLLLALLLFEVPLVIYLIMRAGFVPFPHLNLIYFIGAQIAVFLVSHDFATYGFLRTFSSHAYRDYYTETQLAFAVFFFVFALVFRAPRSRKMSEALARIRSLRFAAANLFILSLILVIFHLIIFASLNWSLVWRNHAYLIMGDPQVLSFQTELTNALFRAYKIIGLLTVVLAAFCYSRRAYSFFALLLPFAIFDIVYQVGAHSRAAVLYLGIAAAVLLLFRKSPWLYGTFGVLTAVALVHTMGGRLYGVHGISTLPYFPSFLSLYIERDPAYAFFNLFEGAFATSELFNRTFVPNATYRFLTFSPLPSFVDGYEAVRNLHQHRLGRYSPPPALFELWSFGVYYIIIYFAVQFLAGMLCIRLLRRGTPMTAMFCNVLMAFAVYIQFTYTVRHVFRIFLIIIAVSAVFLIVQYYNGERRDAPQPRGSYRRRAVPSPIRDRAGSPRPLAHSPPG